MKVRELYTIWGFKVDHKALDKFNDKVNDVKENVKHLGEIAVAQIAALGEMARETAHTAMEAKLAGERLGITAQKMMEVTYAAKMSHVEVEAVSMSLRLLQNHALKAAQGEQEASTLFARLGINIHGANGHIKNSADLLGDIAERFKTTIPSSERAAYAMQLFGRAGTQMIPMLLKGRDGLQSLYTEAHKLGVVIDQDGVEKSERLTEAWNQMTSMLQGIRNTIGLSLMPVLTDFIEKIESWYMANRDLIQQNLVGFFKEMASGSMDLFKHLSSILGVVWKLVEAFGGLGPVLKVVVDSFIAWSALSILVDLVQMVKVIQGLAAALKAAAIWETILTAGANLAVLGGVIAGVGAVAGIGYGISKWNDANEQGPDAKPMTARGAAWLSSQNSSTSHSTVIAPVIHVDARGASRNVGEDLANQLNPPWWKHNLTTSAAPVFSNQAK